MVRLETRVVPTHKSAYGMHKEALSGTVPRGEKRREELIDVAEKIFLERGFPETTMQMIAEAAGASKETLYRHFESKELLFPEIVSRKARAISGPDGAIARGGSPHVVLLALGTSLLTTVCTGQGA